MNEHDDRSRRTGPRSGPAGKDDSSYSDSASAGDASSRSLSEQRQDSHDSPHDDRPGNANQDSPQQREGGFGGSQEGFGGYGGGERGQPHQHDPDRQ